MWTNGDNADWTDRNLLLPYQWMTARHVSCCCYFYLLDCSNMSGNLLLNKSILRHIYIIYYIFGVVRSLLSSLLFSLIHLFLRCTRRCWYRGCQQSSETSINYDRPEQRRCRPGAHGIQE